MTALASTDVTYTVRPLGFEDALGHIYKITLAFGNASLTYDTNGIPLLAGSLGCPNEIRKFDFLNQSLGDGIVYKFDPTHTSIRMYRLGTRTVTGNVAAPTISLASNSGNVAADKVIGLNALSNGASLVGNTVVVNVTGVQAPAFTGDTQAAASLSEFSGAIAATTLIAIVAGY